MIIWFFPKAGFEADKRYQWGLLFITMGHIYNNSCILGTLKHNKTNTSYIWNTRAFVFPYLHLGDFTGIQMITTIAGYVGLLTGLSGYVWCSCTS